MKDAVPVKEKRWKPLITVSRDVTGRQDADTYGTWELNPCRISRAGHGMEHAEHACLRRRPTGVVRRETYGGDEPR